MGDHYSSEEEEVYLGSLAQSEITKRIRLFGKHFTSTPEQLRYLSASRNVQGSLPDVLSGANTCTTLSSSTSVQKKPSDESGENLATQPYEEPQANTIHDDSDVIIINASDHSNSVITLSDDESFVRHENSCLNTSARSEDVTTSVKNESDSLISISSHSETGEVIKANNDSVSPEKKTSPKPPSVSIHDESSPSMLGNKIGLTENSFSTCESSSVSGTANYIELFNQTSYSKKNPHDVIAEDSSFHDSVTNIGNTTGLNDIGTFHTSDNNKWMAKADINEGCNDFSLVQKIDDFVGETNTSEKSSAVTQTLVDHSQSPTTNINLQSLTFSSNHCSNDKSEKRSSFVITYPLPSEEPCGLEKSLNITPDETEDSDVKKGENTFDLSGLINYEFSLNGVSESILNVSRDSPVPSPLKTRQNSNMVVFEKPSMYEDISCDSEQLDNINISDLNENMFQQDFHMSVDEVDFQQQGFSDNFNKSCSLAGSTNISQPSEYISCPPSAHSSYNTAYDQTCCENQPTSEQFNLFQKYRDLSDMKICAEEDAVSINSIGENNDEAGFEMVVQNRQNSFDETPILKENFEGEESKPLTKLPVYHGTKSLLRPPKFHLKPDSLKASSFEFAKQISQTGSLKVSSNIPKLMSPKITATVSQSKLVHTSSIKDKKILLEKGKVFSKTPVKISSPKLNNPSVKMNIPTPRQKIHTPKLNIPNPSQKIHTPKLNIPTPSQKIHTPKLNIPSPKPISSQTKIKTPSQSYLSLSQTPANIDKISAINALHKTSFQNSSGIPRAVKSDTKEKKVLTPLRNLISTVKSAEKITSSKNKYKNIVSPIQAYIKGSPPVLQKKAQMICEEDSPERSLPILQNVAPVQSQPKAMQKLNYDNAPGEENVNPNVINLSRDTIPSKMFEPSLEVFWKQEHVESRLPKMGEKQTKILTGIPKVRVTRHEGRVNECPTSKGVLVPNNELPPTADMLQADNPLKQADGRISVRIQKTVELQ